MKTLILFAIIIGLAFASHAGDIYAGYLPFVGKWEVTQCQDGLKDLILPKKFSISTSRVRKNAVNIYRVNSKGKKDKFYFSTNWGLQNQTLWKLTSDSPEEKRI